MRNIVPLRATKRANYSRDCVNHVSAREWCSGKKFVQCRIEKKLSVSVMPTQYTVELCTYEKNAEVLRMYGVNAATCVC